MLKILKEDLTNESYHNRPNSLSSSDLKPLAKSPELWKFNKANRKESDSMAFGTLFHTAVLEPEKFKPLVMPKYSRAKKESLVDGILAIDKLIINDQDDPKNLYLKDQLLGHKMDDLKSIEFNLLNDIDNLGYQVLDQEDFDKIEAMKAGIKQHEDLCLEGANLISLKNEGCEVESSIFIPLQALEGFEDVELELELRIRPDYFIGGKYIADLKSTKSAEPHAFRRDMFNYGYHVSAAFYIDVYNAYVDYIWTHHRPSMHRQDHVEADKIKNFFLTACENTGSGICTNFEIDPILLDKGREEYRKGLWNYIHSQEGFVYGGYSESIVKLEL